MMSKKSESMLRCTSRQLGPNTIRASPTDFVHFVDDYMRHADQFGIALEHT